MTGVSLELEWQPARRQFTAAEFDQMIEIGVLNEDEPVQLLDGDIILMSPIGPRHAACVKRLNRLLSALLQDSAIVSVQDPISLSIGSRPQPDLALLKPRPDFYASGHPTADDLFVVIEVSDTTSETDRRVKVPAYAAASIPETWIVDLLNDYVEIHSQPNQKLYQQMQIVLRGQQCVSPSLPTLSLTADEILG